jgi:hypothetical protein
MTNESILSVETLVTEAKIRLDEVSHDHQIYDKKLYLVTADLKPFRLRQLERMDKNSFLIVEFLYSKMREGNLKPASRASTIDRLCQLSLFNKNKPFKQMTSEDIFSYLDTIRKNMSAAEDELSGYIDREESISSSLLFHEGRLPNFLSSL